jgi:cell division septation protein DedD
MARQRTGRRENPRQTPKEPRPRSRLAGWLLAAFLICWAFVLGVLVGQGSLASPEQIAWVKQALGLERFWGQETAPPPQRLKDPDLKFYDRVKQQRQTPAPTTDKPAAPQLAAKPETKPEAKATPKPEAKPAAPAARPPAGDKRFAVQVASFSEKNQALNLVRRLQDSGYPAYMLPVRVQGAGRRFRVRVGPYAQLDAAQGAASRIRLQHKLAAYVTRRD